MRDDGITYHQYVTELTWLLFLKMERELRETAERSGRERQLELPKGWRWEDLESKDGFELLAAW